MDRPEQHPTSHRSAAMNLVRSLAEHHIPFGVITKKDLSRLSSFQVVVFPEVMSMDGEEIEALRGYVKAGGEPSGQREDIPGWRRRYPIQ